MSQEKIDRDLTVVKIIGTFISFHDASKPVIWSSKILSDIVASPMPHIITALQWLLKSNYVVSHMGEYNVTSLGREYYESAQANPHNIVSAKAQHDWRNEALTGMTEKRSKITKKQVSIQSDIVNGVLPRTASVPIDDNTAEEIMMGYEALLKRRRRLAVLLGVSTDYLKEMDNAGRLRLCSDDHLGIFDGKNKLCRKCTEGSTRVLGGE